MHDLPIDPYFIERAKSRRGGRLNAYESLTPSKTALVVVDMQDYFVKDGMPSPVPGGRAIVANINRLAQAVRGAKGLVIWIQTEVPADADDWANDWLAAERTIRHFGKSLVAVVYADCQRARSPTPEQIITLAKQTACQYSALAFHDHFEGQTEWREGNDQTSVLRKS